MSLFTISPAVQKTWDVFLANQNNKGHAGRVLDGEDLAEHIRGGMATTRATSARIKKDLGTFTPKTILEIGCSAGLNCFALQEIFPYAQIVGIEPEEEALAAALALSEQVQGRVPRFVRGVGEKIPLADGSVDLVVCHTVIEHVQNVEQVIGEISRVLSKYGLVHLEAPNYVWPYEPHLRIITIPLLGKAFVKLCAWMQGQGAQASFADHLQFVTPFGLERLFRNKGLTFRNRMAEKIQAIFSGSADIRQYKKLAGLLTFCGRVGLGSFLQRIVLATGLYPSVLYTLRKKETL